MTAVNYPLEYCTHYHLTSGMIGIIDKSSTETRLHRIDDQDIDCYA